MCNAKYLSIVFFLLACTVSLRANNLVVTTPTLVGQVPSVYTFVQFNISWDNSWRTSSAPFNYDAVWVFVKYKVEGSSVWNHATLNTTGHTQPSGSIINTPSDGKGVFIYRSADGTGSIDWVGVKLRWNYGAGGDGLADNAIVTVKVFAIEMVYIPQGSFYVGDGTTSDVQAQLHEADDTGTPFNIISEDELTLGGTTAGNLGNNDAEGMYEGYEDDFDNSTQQTLPAAFPKGYDDFYIMKYEITQGQYVAFLNCLTRTQQNTRTVTDVSGTSVTNRYVMSGSSTLDNRNGIRCDGTLSSSDPITFYNDLDGDGTPNESDDGQHIASNWLNWTDGAAYADWAGLRPFTELEFEKACRGTIPPLANEYAWGNTSIHSSLYVPLSQSGEAGELPNSPGTGADGNCVYNGLASVGPLRVGIFATTSSSRISSGATYYGVMHMSGNVFEALVTIGDVEGRKFVGLHGDGILSANGNATNGDWPGIVSGEVTGAEGMGFRGGGRNWDFKVARVSSRHATDIYTINRHKLDGMRLARTSN